VIFSVNAEQLSAALKAAAALTDQLRRLNANLEAGRAMTTPAPDVASAPRPGAPA